MKPWELFESQNAHLVAIDIVGFSDQIDDADALTAQRLALTSSVEQTSLFAKCVRAGTLHWQFLGDEFRIAVPEREGRESIAEFVRQVRNEIGEREDGRPQGLRIGWVTGEVTPREWMKCPYLDGPAAFRVQRWLSHDSLKKGGVVVERTAHGKVTHPLFGEKDWVDEESGDDALKVARATALTMEPARARVRVSESGSHEQHVVVAFRAGHDGPKNDELAQRSFHSLLHLLEHAVNDAEIDGKSGLRVSIAPGGVLLAFPDPHGHTLRSLIGAACRRAKGKLAIAAAGARGYLHEVSLLDRASNFEGRAAIVASRIAADLDAGEWAVDAETAKIWPEILSIAESVMVPGKRNETFPAMVAHDYFDVSFLDIERGIVKREWLQPNERLPREVYAIELLQRPVILERDATGNVMITVDRRGVEECVISNKGKDAIAALVTKEKVPLLREKDAAVHGFLLGEGAPPSMTIDPQELKVPLRWASGGVLSIVTFRGREWVPFFFRDIPPYGWNISLGSAERRFDKERPEREHRDPLDFIFREFGEESLVLSGWPETALEFRPFESDLLRGVSDEHRMKHARKRQSADSLTARLDGSQIPMENHPLRTRTSLKTLSPPIKGQPVTDLATPNVLVCFSLLDLGIEVVRVLTYQLHDDDYLLDGELDFADASVRMPVVLFSREYLHEMFSRRENWDYSYERGAPPSIEVKTAPEQVDLFPFVWDIEQRLKIVKGEKEAPPHVKERFKIWQTKFGANFLHDGGSPPRLREPSRLFVPGTAKILSLFFSKS